MLIAEVGQEAKRQRHVLNQRRYKKRQVGVSQMANTMELHVVVTPTARRVEAEIIRVMSIRVCHSRRCCGVEG